MKHFIIGTAGHIDHGKTALIKALTSIDCDSHKEEKERGITINLGFSYLVLPNGETVGIIDVPGHKDFIRTMVAGAFGIDIVMLVIAADSGIMPQTREHMGIVEMLGIKHGIVALTKSDLVDEETLELARLEIQEFLEGSSIESAPIVSVSSVTGEGTDELVNELSTLVSATEPKEKPGNFRLYIDRLFNVKGIGYVATGTVINGSIESGKEVYLLPGKGKKVRVKTIERHGKKVEKAFSGDRAALNLSGIKPEDFRRGMILSEKPLEETKMVDALVRMFDHNVRTGAWSNVLFYSGTFECQARMHLLDKDTLHPSESAIVQLQLKSPTILLNKDKFILRNSSNDLTLGGGTIIDAHPLHHKKRTTKLVGDLKALVEATLSTDNLYDLTLISLKKESSPMLAKELASRLERTEDDLLREYRESDRNTIRLFSIEGSNVLIENVLNQDYHEKVLEELQEWHQKYPIFNHGLDDKELAGKLGFSADAAGQIYTSGLLINMFNEGLIKKVDNTWVLTGHEVQIDKKLQEQIDWVEHEVRGYGSEKPILTEIEDSAVRKNISKDRLKMILIHLSKKGKVYFFKNDFLHAGIVDRSRERLIKDIINKEKGINEKEFRELIGATKKSAQVILGIFLGEGIVKKETFYIHITDKGKNLLNQNSDK